MLQGLIVAVCLLAACGSFSERSPVVLGRVSCLDKDACYAWLESVQANVYEQWSPDPSIPVGSVKLKFKVDAKGDAVLLAADGTSPELTRSCGDAFVRVMRARRIAPPPRDLVGEALILNFSFQERR